MKSLTIYGLSLLGFLASSAYYFVASLDADGSWLLNAVVAALVLMFTSILVPIMTALRKDAKDARDAASASAKSEQSAWDEVHEARAAALALKTQLIELRNADVSEPES